MRMAYGAGWRLALFLIVIVALVIGPLFLVYRSQCVENGERADSWSIVAPWDDPPADCRGHENGFEVLTDRLGF